MRFGWSMRGWLTVMVMVTVLWVAGLQAVEPGIQIQTPGGILTIDEQSTLDFRQMMGSSLDMGFQAVALLPRGLASAEKQELEQLGISLDTCLLPRQGVWRVWVDKTADLIGALDTGRIFAVASIPPEAKISLPLRRRGFTAILAQPDLLAPERHPAINFDGSVNVTLGFLRNTSADYVRQFLNRYAFQAERIGANDWLVTIDPDNVDAIAADIYVTHLLPPPLPTPAVFGW